MIPHEQNEAGKLARLGWGIRIVMLAEGVINTTRFENDELHWSFSPTCPACQSLNPLDTLIDIDRMSGAQLELKRMEKNGFKPRSTTTPQIVFFPPLFSSLFFSPLPLSFLSDWMRFIDYSWREFRSKC